MIENIITSGIVSIIVCFISGILTYYIQKDRYKKELEIKLENSKTEFMAEKIAKAYLKHPTWKARSFSLLKARLKGFTDEELQKILVRAGAVCIR